MRRPTPPTWVAAAALFFVLAALAAFVVGAVGELFFTLDDAYIHLSVAENLSRFGVYGINPTVPSSPSSSVLWPLVILPFEMFGFGVWGVWLLNAALAMVTVFVVGSLVRDLLPDWRALPVLVAWCVSANLVGLVFTGMEHVAQVAAATIAAAGAVRVAHGDPPPWWLWAALAVGPLVRYENLAITVPVSAWLFALGHRRGALASGTVTLVGLAGFSVALVSHGMWPLPSSVVAKSLHVEGNGIWAPVANALFNVMEWGGGMVLATALALVAIHRFRRDDAPRLAQLALVGVAVAALHLAFGRNGWFHRYEIYALAFTTLVAIAGLRSTRSGWLAAGLTVALLTVGWQYGLGLRRIVPAAANVHAQQYQLHRLAVALGRPVGVNDLGWVSYHNDKYVYDFFGLGNYDAIMHRRAGDDPAWMVSAAEREGLALVMLSPVWFQLEVPPQWRELGSLCLQMRQVTAADVEVRFFSPAEPDAELMGALDRWSATLPESATFVHGRCARDAGLHGVRGADI